MKKAWDSFWFRPARPENVVVARILLALNALWIVLSRPTLPTITSWPEPFWRGASAALRVRFLVFDITPAVERGLYIALLLSLIVVARGRWSRSAAFCAALLLYHFAPFEEILASDAGPYFRGLTVCVTGLFVIAFAPPARLRQPASTDYRWPLILVQLLFAMTYFLAGISKLRIVGPGWATAANFEGLILGMMLPEAIAPWARTFLEHPFLSWSGALAGVSMDLGFILAVFSRRAAMIILPMMLLAHLLIAQLFGIAFLAWPLLLLFVNWERVIDWGAARRTGTVAGSTR